MELRGGGKGKENNRALMSKSIISVQIEDIKICVES
jgi:hypothetical protein